MIEPSDDVMAGKSAVRIDGGQCTLCMCRMCFTLIVVKYDFLKKVFQNHSSVFPRYIYLYNRKTFFFGASYIQNPKLKIIDFRVRFVHSHFYSHNLSVVPV